MVPQGRLPEPYYGEWVNLVKAITLVTDHTIRAADVPRLRHMVVRFATHYEGLYYKRKLVRLPTYRAIFHALLHVADCVEWHGPMRSYAQWTTERMCRLWVSEVKLKAQPDRNLSFTLLRDVQLQYIRYGAVRCQTRIHAIRGWHEQSTDGMGSASGMAMACHPWTHGWHGCVRCQMRIQAIPGWPGPDADDPPHARFPAIPSIVKATS